MTQDDKRILQRLVADEDYMRVLSDVLLKEDTISPEVLLHKTNEELGEIVRAEMVAEDKIKSRLNKIKLLGKSSVGGDKPKA